jgi:phosphatidylglycerol:prolipoprotein diacylglycerol transferase
MLAVIPWFVVPTLHVGPIPLQPFGILSASGILLASHLLVREARSRGLPSEPLEGLATWAVAGGIIGAHFLHLFLYHPEELRQNGPLQILKVWDGLSSTGGVVGGVLASVLFLHRRGLRFSTYADVFAVAVPPGWAVARLGCFSVHDHPGVLTNFFLAVDFPGGARHDLGFYDALVLTAITIVIAVLNRRRAMQNRLLAVVAVLYGASRLGLDFLRARDLPYADARYLGLTPAQYAAILLFAWGAWRLWTTRATRPETTGVDPAGRTPGRA